TFFCVLSCRHRIHSFSLFYTLRPPLTSTLFPYTTLFRSVALCSPFSVTPQLMRDSAELARRHGVRLHTHLAETLDEESFCIEKFGRRPVEQIGRASCRERV